MGCGKEVQGRPEEEYESYVFDLKAEVNNLDDVIKAAEQHKKELEDEVRLACVLVRQRSFLAMRTP